MTQLTRFPFKQMGYGHEITEGNIIVPSRQKMLSHAAKKEEKQKHETFLA